MFNDPGYTIIMQQKVLKFYRICPFVLRSGRFFPYYQILDLGKKLAFVKHSSLPQRNVGMSQKTFRMVSDLLSSIRVGSCLTTKY